MKEFHTIFKTSLDGTFEDFSALFIRELKLLLGNVTKLEEMEERQLDGVRRELANPDSIGVLEREEGGKAVDLLLMPLRSGSGKIHYIVAEGSLRNVDVDHLHLLKWLYETRVDTDARLTRFRQNSIYDYKLGVLSRMVIPSLFEMEKSRAQDFGSSMAFLVLRVRQEQLMETIGMIRKNMRRTDYLFGLSGAELLMILVECSAYGSEAMMVRIKKMLGNKLLACGYSIFPEQGETCDTLISEAQASLV